MSTEGENLNFSLSNFNNVQHNAEDYFSGAGNGQREELHAFRFVSSNINLWLDNETTRKDEK